MVGVSRQMISSIEIGEFNPTPKLALILCVALDKKLRIYFDFSNSNTFFIQLSSAKLLVLVQSWIS